jgi:hypothetical protein
MKVLVSTNRMASVYHTQEDCEFMGDSMVQKPLDVINATYEQCKWCSGEAERTGKYEKRECEACGESYKEIANHLANCSEL